jgi:hypothetical protein
VSRHALDEARASEPLSVTAVPSARGATEQPVATSDDLDAERAVLYDQVIAGLHAVDTDKPQRTLPEFHDWFTPTVPSEAAGEMPAPASEAGDDSC